MDQPETSIDQAVAALSEGRIIAYPTEAVYGLGCDPNNADAVQALLSLKARSSHKGFVLVAASWAQVEPLISAIPAACRARIEQSWPGPVTWVFPATSSVPPLVRGQHETVAIRISAHPIIQELCTAFDGPIISTSANRQHREAARSLKELQLAFGAELLVVAGALGQQARPTPIRDALTNNIIRPA